MINTGIYCHHDGATVDVKPTKLPQNWEGSSNINNVDNWGDARLAIIGWLPYLLVDAGYPSQYYLRTLSDYDIQPTEITQTAIYAQWDIELVRGSKVEDLDRGVSIIDANTLASDTLIRYTVQNEVQWAAEKKGELARLETWQEIADFDTSKPTILTLSNDYIGAQNVEQGVRMIGDNLAAVDAGLPEPHDPVTLQSWVASNDLAAKDPSGSTPPLSANYRLRQSVSSANEGVSELWLYRYRHANVNPVTDFNYRIQLLNKQDARKLYVFSYFNGGTYLAWHELTLQQDGSWRAEGHSSEWQYAPGDMAFTFSYGTNEAIESDYFTNQIAFPAGVDQQVSRIRWDKV